MGIEIEMTGSGELGPLAPGWSVQEYATPIVIGDTAGGTGNVSFNAAAREDSLFVVNNEVTTTEETLGSISGVVKSVSQSGLNVSVTHNTKMSIFDATKDIPSLGAGGIYPAVDLCSQLSGRDNLLIPTEGYFYSLRGHSAGFNSSGEQVEISVKDGSYQVLNPDTTRVITLKCTTTAGSATVTTSNTAGLIVGATIAANASFPAGKTIASIVNSTTFTINSGTSVVAGTGVSTTITNTIAQYYYPVYYREYYGRIWANAFTVNSNEIWATQVTGDTFSNNKALPTSRLAFKTKLNGGSANFSFSALPDDSNVGSGQTVNIMVDAVTQKIYLTGKYRSSGILKNLDANASFPAAVNLANELAVFIQYSRPVTGNIYSINIKVCNTTNYAIYAELATTYDADISYYNDSWYLSGIIRSLYRHQGSTELAVWTPAEYENAVTYSSIIPIEIDGAVPAQSKTNMWEYLQQACAAYNKEIALVAGTIIIRNVGSTEIDISNVAGAPTISPNITMSGRSVEVVYTNATIIVNQEIYNAKTDNNRVLSVKAGETITTTVEVNGNPAIVNIPTRTTGIGALTGLGQYAIADSNGVAVPYNVWAKYGGRVDVTLSDTASNAIDITLTGPYSTDGIFNKTVINGTDAAELYPSPYKLAFTADGTDYAALSIVGSGIKITNQTLKLRTAADPNKVAQDVAKTITNPFISDSTQAYDRGIYAAADIAGPRVMLSASVPVSTVNSFGLVAGSRIRYRDSIYRVMDATIGNLAVNVNAVRHVTLNDFDTLWLGRTVGLHDAMWAGYDTTDQVIAPLRFIGDDETVLMFLDTDVIPYYDFSGNPEISVFDDTDANPFYEDGGDLPGSDPIYLDEDSTPYE